MRVLWITNILFPDICEDLKVTTPVTGGWMHASAQAILEQDNQITLAVATLYGDKLYKKNINRITYYCLPFNIYKQNSLSDIGKIWNKIEDDFHPDIVHIHGTEYPHGLAYMQAVRTNNVVISIQGLISVYNRYKLGGIPYEIIKRYLTIYDLLKGNILKISNRTSKEKLEKLYFKLANHIIGRTDWDRIHAWALNPQAQYHYCNETLRKSFYNSNWNLAKCERYSIFLSQAYTPIKGIHAVIKALPLIIRHFPDVKVYVSGFNFTKKATITDKLKYSTFANYISHLMNHYGVKDKFTFLGFLNEEEMVQRYLKAHVFICPSCIENSPNSLGEAQIVGTPTIASYVGGIPNMIIHEKTGLLYRFEEFEMLAYHVCRIFENDELAISLSNNERFTASIRHNPQNNARKTIEIYNEIIENETRNYI